MIGDTIQHIGEPGAGIDIVESRRDDERIHRGRPFATAVTAREQPALPAESHHPFILPMSGKSWKSTTGGIPIFGARFLFGA